MAKFPVAHSSIFHPLTIFNILSVLSTSFEHFPSVSALSMITLESPAIIQ